MLTIHRDIWNKSVKLEGMILVLLCLFHLILAQAWQRNLATFEDGPIEYQRPREGGGSENLQATSRLFFPGAGQLMAGMGQAVQPLLLMLGLHSALMMFPQMVQKAIAPKYDAFYSWRRDSDRMSPRIRNTWKLLNGGWQRYGGRYNEQYQEPIFMPRY